MTKSQHSNVSALRQQLRSYIVYLPAPTGKSYHFWPVRTKLTKSYVIIAISLALLGIALMARKGYIGAGALTPAIFAFLVGLIQYPPTGIAPVIAPFILSLWFPGIALLVLGLVYLFLSIRKA